MGRDIGLGRPVRVAWAGLFVLAMAWGAWSQEAASTPAPQTLGVVGAYPLPGERLRNEVIFFFSEDIAKASDLRPVESNPTMPMEYQWGRNYLRIVPPKGEQWQFGLYEVQLRADVIQGASGALLAPEDVKHVFATFNPVPSGIHRLRRSQTETVLQIGFGFDVQLSTLRERLRVEDSRKQVIPVTFPDGDPLIKALNISIPATNSFPVRIIVTKGFQDSRGLRTLDEDYSYNYPPTNMQLQSVDWLVDGGESLRFQFSRVVNGEEFRQHLSIVDAQTGEAVPYSMQNLDNYTRHTVYFDAPQAEGSGVRVTVRQGLLSQDDAIMAVEYSKIVQRPQRQFTMDYHYWRERGVEGPVLILNFDRNVQADEVEKYLRLDPPVENVKVSAGGYGRSVEISGAWRSEVEYKLTIEEGLTSTDGAGRFHGERSLPLEAVPKYKAAAFSEEGKLYFPRRASGHLLLRARNAEKVTASIHQLFPNNLVPAVQFVNSDKTDSNFNYQWARLVETRTIEMPGPQDTVVERPLDLNEMLPADRRGVFSISLSPSSDYQNTKIVLWTDIGVLAHWQRDALLVFTHNLFTLEPLTGAKVSLYSHKNQLLGVTTTNALGVAGLDALDASLGDPKLLVVETENDYTFLQLEPREEDHKPFDDTMPAFDRSGYDAFLYADRGIYRPGETVHARWLVRTNYGDAVPEVPFQTRLLNPKGVEVFVEPTTTSTVGSGGMDIETKPSYLTGKYTLELRVPEGKTIGRYEFNVEEFVPNRIEANLEIAASPWRVGTPYDIHVDAQHLFGAPAAGRRVVGNVLLEAAEFKPKGLEGFHFGNDTPFQMQVEALGEQKTDDTGKATFEFTYRPKTEVTTPLQALVRAQVFETGGRAVVAGADALLLPSDVLLGLRVEAGGEQQLRVDVAAITPDETPAALDKVKVTIEQRSWSYYVRRYAGYNTPNWTEYYEPVETREVALVDGRGSITFQYPRYGYYRIKVHSDATPQYSTQKICAYWYGPKIVTGEQPSLITLRLDRENYMPGDEAILSIESPFDGRGIVVLHGDRFERVFPVTVTQGKGELRFTLTRDNAPNMWAEATIIHGAQTGTGNVYPYSSFAMVNVPVRERERTLQVAITDLPEEVRPAQRTTIHLETRDHAGAPVGAEVTLAAVDQGIHNILGYVTPDPASWFTRSRQPDFRRAHYYDKVAYDFEAPRIGGDLLRKRLGKDDNLGENWIKPVALWSGVVQTDADGKASVDLDLPEFNGQLRLVAVAVTESASGAGDARLYVRRPYMLRTTMPRFALPGDAFTCRAVLFNTTDAPVRVRLETSGQGTVTGGPDARTLDVPAKGDVEATMAFAAAQAIGQGAILWTAEFQALDGTVLERLEERAPVPVRPPSSFKSDHELTVLDPGMTKTFQTNQYLDAPPVETSIVVSGSPSLQLEDALRFLVGYPYGCIEQTLSRCLPVYLLRQDAALIRRALNEQEKLEYYLQAGIDRLFSMQNSTGGLGYWPGSSDTYDYGSVYACHFLTLVGDAPALDVPEESFAALKKHVRAIAMSTNRSRDSDYLRAYACYVLALGGDLEAIQLIERFDNITLPRPARYLLAAALALQTGDKARVEEYLATRPMVDYYLRETAGDLHSEARNKAVELLALLAMDTPTEQIYERATELIRHLRSREYRTTQDLAFLISAVGLYIQKLGVDAVAVAGMVTGPDGDVKVDGTTALSDLRKGQGTVYTVRNEGSVPLYVAWTTAGVPKAPSARVVSEGMSVVRSFLQRGAAYDGTEFRHGDSYVVKLSLTCNTDLQNIVVADQLPAGFEIENPRLDSNALAAEGVENSLTPAYLEVRDDRLVLAFDRLSEGDHDFHYVVRAVTAGSFHHPPVHAECMYDPQVVATSATAEIEIK